MTIEEIIRQNPSHIAEVLREFVRKDRPDVRTENNKIFTKNVRSYRNILVMRTVNKLLDIEVLELHQAHRQFRFKIVLSIIVRSRKDVQVTHLENSPTAHGTLEMFFSNPL